MALVGLTVLLAGCPGQLDFPVSTAPVDSAPAVPPLPVDGSPPPPVVPDASRTPPPAPDAAPPPPPPAADAGAAPASFCTTTDQVVARILRPRCGMCHDTAATTFVPPDLVGSGVRERLRQRSALCVGRTFVVTSPAVGGHFFDKLGPMPTCGTRMPPFGAALEAAEIDCLKAWAAANP